MYQDDSLYSKYICIDCWKCILNFHELYLNVEQKHKSLYEKLEVKTKNEISDSNVEYLDIKIEPNVTVHTGTIDDKITYNVLESDNDYDQDFAYDHKSSDDDECK